MTILIASIDDLTGKITYVRVPADRRRVAVNIHVTDEQLVALNAAPNSPPLIPLDENGRTIAGGLYSLTTSRKRTALVVATLADHCRPVVGDTHADTDGFNFQLDEMIYEFADGM